MARYHSFLWLITAHCLSTTPSLSNSSADGHLHCFLIWAIVNNAAVDIRCLYLLGLVFSFSLSRYPILELLDPNALSIFKLLKSRHTVFHCGKHFKSQNNYQNPCSFSTSLLPRTVPFSVDLESLDLESSHEARESCLHSRTPVLPPAGLCP